MKLKTNSTMLCYSMEKAVRKMYSNSLCLLNIANNQMIMCLDVIKELILSFLVSFAVEPESSTGEGEAQIQMGRLIPLLQVCTNTILYKLHK